MRKSLGVLLAAALMLPVGVIAASPGGAAGGTTCTTSAGSAKFTPPLPILSSAVKVSAKLTASGTVGGCTGTVKSGKTVFTQTSKITPGNCTTLTKPDPKSKGTIGKLVITWNTGKTSTATAFTVKQTKAITTSTTTGKITAGLFVGSSITGSVTYKVPTGGCSSKPLATVTYAGAKGVKFVIK